MKSLNLTDAIQWTVAVVCMLVIAGIILGVLTGEEGAAMLGGER